MFSRNGNLDKPNTCMSSSAFMRHAFLFDDFFLLPTETLNLDELCPLSNHTSRCKAKWEAHFTFLSLNCSAPSGNDESVRTIQITHAQFCAQVSGFLDTIREWGEKGDKEATNLGLFANVARLVTSHPLHILICHTFKIRNLPCPL